MLMRDGRTMMLCARPPSPRPSTRQCRTMRHGCSDQRRQTGATMMLACSCPWWISRIADDGGGHGRLVTHPPPGGRGGQRPAVQLADRSAGGNGGLRGCHLTEPDAPLAGIYDTGAVSVWLCRNGGRLDAHDGRCAGGQLARLLHASCTPGAVPVSVSPMRSKGWRRPSIARQAPSPPSRRQGAWGRGFGSGGCWAASRHCSIRGGSISMTTRLRHPAGIVNLTS
jgi:hypothetical protein